MTRVDPTDLDRAAAATRRTHELAAHVDLMIHCGETQRARELAQDARDTAWTAYSTLLSAGAAPVEGVGVPAEVPLHLLDTPATNRLLCALVSAIDAARDVDRERGWLQNGQPCGWTDTIGDLCQKLQIEIHGPSGGERE